jgi:hypothetical protein
MGLFRCGSNLKLDSSEYVIVVVGVNLQYFSMLHVEGLRNEGEDWSYNGLSIINIYNQMNDLARQSFFILKKTDLPVIVYNDMPQEIVDKFHLEKIDEHKNIYAKLLDLNKPENENIRDEISETGVDDPSMMVLVCVGINTEIRYRNNAKMVQLKIFDQFDDRGTVNTLSDIKLYDNK